MADSTHDYKLIVTIKDKNGIEYGIDEAIEKFTKLNELTRELNRLIESQPQKEPVYVPCPVYPPYPSYPVYQQPIFNPTCEITWSNGTAKEE